MKVKVSFGRKTTFDSSDNIQGRIYFIGDKDKLNENGTIYLNGKKYGGGDFDASTIEYLNKLYIQSIESGGYIATTDQILDTSLNKTQEEINAEISSESAVKIIDLTETEYDSPLTDIYKTPEYTREILQYIESQGVYGGSNFDKVLFIKNGYEGFVYCTPIWKSDGNLNGITFTYLDGFNYTLTLEDGVKRTKSATSIYKDNDKVIDTLHLGDEFIIRDSSILEIKLGDSLTTDSYGNIDVSIGGIVEQVIPYIQDYEGIFNFNIPNELKLLSIGINLATGTITQEQMVAMCEGADLMGRLHNNRNKVCTITDSSDNTVIITGINQTGFTYISNGTTYKIERNQSAIWTISTISSGDVEWE